MKTLAPLLLVLCSAPLALTAQEFHLSGGYNGSNVSTAGNERWVGRAGYQFGADVLLGHQFFLKGGLHFVVRNLNYSLATTEGSGVSTSTTDFKYTSRSLMVPVQLGFNLINAADDPAVNLYVFGGAAAFMNLSADLDQDQLNVDTAPAQWYAGFGAGLTLGFLFLEGGYDVALSNQFSKGDFDTNPKVNFVHAIAGLRLKLAGE